MGKRPADRHRHHGSQELQRKRVAGQRALVGATVIDTLNRRYVAVHEQDRRHHSQQQPTSRRVLGPPLNRPWPRSATRRARDGGHGTGKKKGGRPMSGHRHAPLDRGENRHQRPSLGHSRASTAQRKDHPQTSARPRSATPRGQVTGPPSSSNEDGGRPAVIRRGTRVQDSLTHIAGAERRD